MFPTLPDPPIVVLEDMFDFLGEREMDPVFDPVIGYGGTHLWGRMLGASVSG